MGRIFRHRAGRRMFVGVLALAGLALVACEPLTQPPAAEPQLFEPRCTPLCVLIPPGSPGACERVLDPTK